MAEGGGSYIALETETSQANLVQQQAETDFTDKMDSVDIILQRSISERENELRQIQNDNRPVTGQEHRQNIDHFLTKNIQIRDNVEAQHASGKENVPLNSIHVEEHRPEAVVIEIQGLSQQQRVSNVLQTAAFRRHLEGIIRGSLGTVARNHSNTTSTQSSARPSPSPAPTQPATPVRDQTPQREEIPEVLTERRGSVSSSSSSSANSFVEYNQRIQDPRGLLTAHLNNRLPQPAHPAPALPPVAPSPGPVDTSSIMRELHREDLVQEVSELVHRRLVTSTLEGEFRNVLEVHVGERVQAAGSDGQRVAAFIQSIPQTDIHIRNDFSELGLPPPAGADNWDNVSVTSISATAVPYTQTNLHLSREIAALKTQLQEMKNMMKLSFDLQMDIQRSIRQEVAAGIAAATGKANAEGNTEDPSLTASIPRSKPINDTHCLICLDNHSDSVLYQCGHMCVCFPCGRHLMDRQAKCPVCRAPIRDVIRAYKCNQD